MNIIRSLIQYTEDNVGANRFLLSLTLFFSKTLL